jgi:hypothetical protein
MKCDGASSTEPIVTLDLDSLSIDELLGLSGSLDAEQATEDE